MEIKIINKPSKGNVLTWVILVILCNVHVEFIHARIKVEIWHSYMNRSKEINMFA